MPGGGRGGDERVERLHVRPRSRPRRARVAVHFISSASRSNEFSRATTDSDRPAPFALAVAARNVVRFSTITSSPRIRRSRRRPRARRRCERDAIPRVPPRPNKSTEAPAARVRPSATPPPPPRASFLTARPPPQPTLAGRRQLRERDRDRPGRVARHARRPPLRPAGGLAREDDKQGQARDPTSRGSTGNSPARGHNRRRASVIQTRRAEELHPRPPHAASRGRVPVHRVQTRVAAVHVDRLQRRGADQRLRPRRGVLTAVPAPSTRAAPADFETDRPEPVHSQVRG